MTRSNFRNRLSVLDGFGSNPGSLGAAIYAPPQLAKRSPLVVVLHGSSQDAKTYDHGAGWSLLADEGGFALLFTEQRRRYHSKLSFNWYERLDSGRDAGEPLSIRQMIEHVASDLEIDPDRIFVTGLSFGGAMACVMLATYPEVFAGGAVIGGLPYRTATTVFDALVRMEGYGGPSDRRTGSRRLSPTMLPGPRCRYGTAIATPLSILRMPRPLCDNGRPCTASRGPRR